MRALIAGAGGQLGRSLQVVLQEKNFQFLPLSSSELDITNLPQVLEVVESANVDVILNAAAYTDVEAAEFESEKAFQINEAGARNLAIAARENNLKVMHFSTDYVFSGARSTPWLIDSEVNPLSEYGKSKLAGEIAIRQECPDNSLIIRTAWLYSPYGRNFFKTMLNLALTDSGSINVVNDQLGQPTNANDLAHLAISALQNNVPAGIYHGTNSGSATWYDFAITVFQLAGADINRINAVGSNEYPSKVTRPGYSVLDNSKWAQFDIMQLGSWQESVKHAFPALYESLS